MKILMVSESIPSGHLGGLGKHALNLANELSKRGHVVDFLGNADEDIAAQPEQAGSGQFFGELTGYATQWKRQRLGAFNPLEILINGRILASTILRRSAGYDVVHYHGHLPWIGAFIPNSIPFIQTRHDQSGDCILKTRYRSGIERCDFLEPQECAGCAVAAPNALQRWSSAFTVRKMRALTGEAYRKHPVIFVSKFLQSAAVRTIRRPAHGYVIHNSVNGDAIRAAVLSRPPSPRQDNQTVFFAAGAMLRYKGFEELLACLRQTPLPRNSRLELAGDGPLLNGFREKYGNIASIRFLGWMNYDHIITHILNSDAVIVPSLWDEPCATTVLEALALGRTVYALRRGGTPELTEYIQRGSGDLLLFDDLPGLVSGLRRHVPAPMNYHANICDFRGTMHLMADKILDVYGRHFSKS